MALIGTINIAMTAATEKLAKGFQQAQGMVGGFVKSLGGVGSLIAGSFAGAGVAALGHFAGLADDLSDNVERLQTMFGDASGTIVEQAEKMNAAFGVSEITFTSAATKLGGIFKAMGTSEDKAAGMTTQLLTLTQAIAQFKGIKFEEALGRIQMGLMGKAKGVKEFGINVSATMSTQERFNALMSGGADIIATMDQRAMDSGASWDSLRGRIEQIEILIGQTLPEVVEPFFAELNTAVVAAKQWWDDLSGSTKEWGQSSLESIKGTVDSMGFLQRAIGFIADTWQVVGAAFHGFRAIVTSGIGYIVDGLNFLAQRLDYFVEKMTGKSTGLSDFLETWGDDLHNTAQQEFADLKKDWAKPWSSEGINAAFEKAKQKIAGDRQSIMNAALGSHVNVTDKKVKHPKKEFAEAMGVGTKEAASTILRSKYGIGSEKDMQKVAANSEKTVAALERIATATETLASDGGDMGYEAINTL